MEMTEYQHLQRDFTSSVLSFSKAQQQTLQHRHQQSEYRTTKD